MVKWITENIGTDAYLNAINIQNVKIIDVRDLVDKSGNDTEPIVKKINDALELLKKGNKVIICCDYGMSRSNSIAAGVIARYKNISFNQAVQIVMQATNETAIKIEVLSSVRNALGENLNTIKNNEKRLLVTGSSGFIGSSLVPTLKTKNILFTPSSKELNILENPAAIDLYVKENNITHLLHLAAPHVYTTHKSFGETLNMFRNILDICKENNIKLIYPSNCVVYSGYKTGFLSASENLPVFPNGIYGETKYFCEILLKHYQQIHGLEYFMPRLSPIYGNSFDKPKFIYNFIDKALKNETIRAHEYLNGFPSLDLLYIDDLVIIFNQLIDQDYTGEINIGSGRGTSTTEIAQIIVELLGSKSTIEHNKINEYSSNIVMNISKVEQLLGWNPKTSIKEGLKTVISGKIKT
ncbi:MAG: NAD-dependent epimerase/dehydratase family protein [Candidatus Gastranaerophilaceae bacterium]|jgi:UDP-glucuronate decarboxylase